MGQCELFFPWIPEGGTQQIEPGELKRKSWVSHPISMLTVPEMSIFWGETLITESEDCYTLAPARLDQKQNIMGTEHCACIIHCLVHHSDPKDRFCSLFSPIIWEWLQGQNVGMSLYPLKPNRGLLHSRIGEKWSHVWPSHIMAGDQASDVTWTNFFV